VILALLVMALGAALTLPALVSPGGSELRTATGTVVAGLRRAREEALNRQAPATLTVDVAARAFTVDASGEHRQLPARVRLSLFTARSEVEDEDRGRIRFFPDGSSTGGRVTLSGDGREYHVDVDWLTGQVRVRAGDGDPPRLARGQVGLGS
jgi:general secretion pathway protein H